MAAPRELAANSRVEHETLTIAFLDLKAINLRDQARFQTALQRVLESGWLVLGNEVAVFEAAFAKYCETERCIGVGNGLDALHLALKAWNIGPGDEVIVPSNTYIATWLAVTYTGARPIPVEPVAATYNLDPERIETAITPRTKAIIAVHLYGQMADMPAIAAVARRRGLKLLEDAAQSHGARWQGRSAGAVSDAVAYSFYPGKNLGALGDGGALTTNDSALADRIAMLRNYGSRQKYENEIVGYNSRLDELQAAFLSAKLTSLDEDNARRRVIARRYHAAFAPLPDVIVPVVPDEADPVWHLYVVRTSRRDALQAFLRERQIGTLIHYPIPPHLQEAYRSLGYGPGSFPLSEAIHREVLSLPIGPTMTDDEVERVIAATTDFFRAQP